MGRKKKAVVVEERKPLIAYKQETSKVSLIERIKNIFKRKIK